MTRRLRGAALVSAMVVLLAAAHLGSGSFGHDHGRMPTAVRTASVAVGGDASAVADGGPASVSAGQRIVLAEARVASLGPASAARGEPVSVAASDPGAPPATTAPAPSTRPYLGKFLVTCYVLRGTTKSGRPVSRDVVAVDPKVIPLGTRLGIAGIGPRFAADTGRLIRGNHLDVWMPSHDDCVRFGRRHLDVYLIP